MKRLIAGKLGFTAEEMKILAGRSPHALRHTSDTRSQRDYRPMSPNAFEDTLPRRPHDFRTSGEATDAAARESFQRAQMTVAGVASASARKRGGGTTRGGDVPPSLRAISRLLIAKSRKQRGCRSTTLLQTELLLGFAGAPLQAARSPV